MTETPNSTRAERLARIAAKYFLAGACQRCRRGFKLPDGHKASADDACPHCGSKHITVRLEERRS